jgi:hypothetical protein
MEPSFAIPTLQSITCPATYLREDPFGKTSFGLLSASTEGGILLCCCANTTETCIRAGNVFISKRSAFIAATTVANSESRDSRALEFLRKLHEFPKLLFHHVKALFCKSQHYFTGANGNLASANTIWQDLDKSHGVLGDARFNTQSLVSATGL